MRWSRGWCIEEGLGRIGAQSRNEIWVAKRPGLCDLSYRKKVRPMHKCFHGLSRNEPALLHWRWFVSMFVALVAMSTVARAQSYGLDTRPAVGPFLNGVMPPQAQSASGWQAAVAFPNLTFDDPISITPEPRSSRIYVCGREGPIYFFTNDQATTTKTLFLDLTSQTQGNDDCGVLGFAFHPQYGVPGSPNRGYVYVWYQYSPSPNPNPVETTLSYNRLRATPSAASRNPPARRRPVGRVPIPATTTSRMTILGRIPTGPCLRNFTPSACAVRIV